MEENHWSNHGSTEEAWLQWDTEDTKNQWGGIYKENLVQIWESSRCLYWRRPLPGSPALIIDTYCNSFMIWTSGCLVWQMPFLFPFPTASTGHFCGRTDERSYLCNIYVPAILWEAVLLLLLPRTGLYCGVLEREGRHQVRQLIFVISFFLFSF